jgi:hypothetical protein
MKTGLQKLRETKIRAMIGATIPGAGAFLGHAFAMRLLDKRVGATTRSAAV